MPEQLNKFHTSTRELTWAMRDAVIEGFRFHNGDRERIATPQPLDELAENSLGLRFGDAQFGREVYADIRYQVMITKKGRSMPTVIASSTL